MLHLNTHPGSMSGGRCTVNAQMATGQAPHLAVQLLRSGCTVTVNVREWQVGWCCCHRILMLLSSFVSFTYFHGFQQVAAPKCATGPGWFHVDIGLRTSQDERNG